MNEWQMRAACRDHPHPEWWFPEVGHDEREARQICAGCPVREQCLDYALRHHIRDGIWAGTNWKDRRRRCAA